MLLQYLYWYTDYAKAVKVKLGEIFGSIGIVVVQHSLALYIPKISPMLWWHWHIGNNREQNF